MRAHLPQGPSQVKVIPLGGVGAFGMNMMLFEYEEQIIIVDAGLMFPHHDLPGVDFVIPDFTYLRRPSKKILGIFLTHGHLDHIGALPYLLREMNPPIWGAPLTLALLTDRLKEHRRELCVEMDAPFSAGRLPRDACAPDIPPDEHAETLQLAAIVPGEQKRLGPFCVEAIHVTHSIADSLGYAITTPVGCFIHTGDFKIDPTPARGATMDARRFIEYGDRGVLALISDSTNAEQAGVSGSEAVVGETFDRLFPDIPGRIILTTFASHLHRIDRVAQSAMRCGRKLFLTGKSMMDAVRIGHQMGYLSFPADEVAPLSALNTTPDREAIILTTGSQGEPSSALSRMAMDDHRQIQILPGDTVIFSARVIPGNEQGVSRIINALLRKGVNVLYDKVDRVHVSGHANQDEQRQMIQWTRPRYFIPVHGEYRQMVAHARVAKAAGLSAAQIILTENGETLLFGTDGYEKGKPVPAVGVYVDGKEVGTVEETTLSERRQMGSDGILVVTFTTEGERVRSEPMFFSRGFVGDDPDLLLWKEMRRVIATLFEHIEQAQGADAPPPIEDIEKRIKKTLKKWLAKKHERTPLILCRIVPAS